MGQSWHKMSLPALLRMYTKVPRHKSLAPPLLELHMKLSLEPTRRQVPLERQCKKKLSLEPHNKKRNPLAGLSHTST